MGLDLTLRRCKCRTTRSLPQRLLFPIEGDVWSNGILYRPRKYISKKINCSHGSNNTLNSTLGASPGPPSLKLSRPLLTTRGHGSFELSQKPRATILAAIPSQAKKRESDVLQEVLLVRKSHIRTMTLRAGPCSPHETGFGRCTHSILCRGEGINVN